MKCPKCGSQSYVYTTLPVPGRSETKRYRKCHACGNKWRTIEYVVPDGYKVAKPVEAPKKSP